MSGHTPGPWFPFIARNGRHRGTIAIHDKRRKEIITWSGFDGVRADGAKSWERRAANARLIAAAPLLLAACKSALHAMDQVRVAVPDVDEAAFDSATQEIEAAIAAAEPKP